MSCDTQNDENFYREAHKEREGLVCFSWRSSRLGGELIFRTVVPYRQARNGMRKDAAFEAEFLIAPKLGLVIVVEMSCTIALSAELLVYPWPPDFPTRPPWVSNLSNGAEEITFNAPIDGIYQVEVFGYSAAAYKLLVELDSVTAASGDLANQLTLPGGLDPNKPRPEAPVVPLQSKQQIGPDLQQTFYLPYVAR